MTARPSHLKGLSLIKQGDFVKYRSGQGKYFSLVLRIESDGTVVVRNGYRGKVKRVTRPENLIVIKDFYDT